MNHPLVWIIIVAACAAVVLIVAASALSRRAHLRSAELRSRFGPEYERAVREYGGPTKAERILADRERRVERFRFRELSEQERVRFASRWDMVQAQFVDDPGGAVERAENLITEVMTVRGYPSRDYDQRVADLSVNHAAVVQHYRAAHALTARQGSAEQRTEDLRQAVVHYRALFAELLAPASEERNRVLRPSHA